MIIALSHIAAREQWLLETIREMAAHTMPPGGMVNDIGNDQLNAEQQQAVGRALRAPISCVTGPAGSGKTFAISHACTCFENAGLSIALAAPTGKAARRLSESSGRSAGTIHRLLMHDGVRFQFNAETQLKYDVIIVDEVSMMDINLAWSLFQAIDARCTRVILVGDHNQLPPVGPGNLLRDIITHEIIPVTNLKTIIRQAGKLRENSNLILGGVAAKTSKPEWYVFNGWPGAPASKFQDADDVLKFLLALFSGPLKNQLGVADLVNDVQVLAPMKNGTLGVNNLNIQLQALLQKQINNIYVEPVAPKARPALYVGDKIMQIKNNYKMGAAGIMNGTTGHVISTKPLVINFDGEAVKIESDYKNQQVLAYAATVHKLQGSEVPVVIYVCHKSQSFMHHRNLFYTAVTRAKRTAIIIGDAWAIRHCAATVETARRKTIIAALCAAK